MAKSLKPYKAPLIKEIVVEVETVIATSGDPIITNPDMGWGQKERRGEWGNLWNK